MSNKPKIVSHRGAKGLAPENTLKSFELAKKFKPDYIEFDLRTTKDGKVVVWHDPKLNGLKINETNYIALKKSCPELLTFDQVIPFLSGQKMLIDIKSGSNLNPIIELIEKFDICNKSIVTSFSYRLLKNIKQMLPDLEILVIHKWSAFVVCLQANKLGTKNICLNHLWLWRGVIKNLKRHNYKLYTYTVNSPKRALKLASFGVDATVTDFPDKFNRD